MMKEQLNLRALPPEAKSEEAKNSTNQFLQYITNLMEEPDIREVSSQRLQHKAESNDTLIKCAMQSQNRNTADCLD